MSERISLNRPPERVRRQPLSQSWLLLAGTLGIGLVMMLPSVTLATGTGLFEGLCYLAAAVSVVGVATQLVRRQVTIFEALPWFVIFAIGYIVIRPLVLIDIFEPTGTGTVVGMLGLTFSVPVVVQATAYALIGLGAFVVGYQLPGTRRAGLRLANSVLEPIRNQTVASGTIAALLIVGLVGRFLIVQIKGGTAGFQDARGLNNAGLGPVWFLAGLSITVGVFYVWAAASSLLRRSRLVELLIVLTTPSILFINSRGGFLYFALAAIFAYRLARPKASVIMPIAVAVAVVILWGSIRGQITESQGNDIGTDFVQQIDDLDHYTASALSLGVTDFYWLVVENTPGIATFQYGAVLGRTVLDLVPRALWPSKPLGIGNYFMEVFFPEMFLTNTVTPGLFGILYLDAGLIGIALGCLALGFAMRALFLGHNYSTGPSIATLVYVFAFPNIVNVMQSGAHTVLLTLIWSSPPILLVLFLGGARFRRTPLQAGPNARLPVPSSRVVAPGARAAVTTRQLWN
jgi:oligosaccharide repeat unit polymerase